MTEINKTFAYHKPSNESLATITELRKAFSELENLVCTVVPHSRQASLALTKLEEAAMWAIKGVVSNDPESIAEK